MFGFGFFQLRNFAQSGHSGLGFVRAVLSAQILMQSLGSENKKKL
jgi:hypothetical protein